MKATVVVTNQCFRHVSHSFNRAANNTGKKTKTLLANTAFLYKKRAGRGLAVFFLSPDADILKIPLVPGGVRENELLSFYTTTPTGLEETIFRSGSIHLFLTPPCIAQHLLQFSTQ